MGEWVVHMQVNVEKHYQHLCDSWRMELETKESEFEKVKTQIMNPRCVERSGIVRTSSRCVLLRLFYPNVTTNTLSHEEPSYEEGSG